MAENTPKVVVLGGCNGSGKTTASKRLLADTLSVKTFVNADHIAHGLAGFDPHSANLEASRIMLDRLHKLAEAKESFAFETTLAGKSYATFLKRLRGAGYRIELYYFWLGNADLNVARVAARVAAGGHNVPEATIRQRYHRSMENFFSLYRPLCDQWDLYLNCRSRIDWIATGTPSTFLARYTDWEEFIHQATGMSGSPHSLQLDSPPNPTTLLAVQRAVRDARWTHARLDRPVCEMGQSKVVWISPEDELARLAAAELPDNADSPSK